MVSRVPLVILAGLLLTSCATRYRVAQPSWSDWAAVVALPIEERVEVLTTKGRSVSGTLKAVDFTHLELDPLSIHLPRTDVAAVWKLGQPDRLRNGALVGGAIGLIRQLLEGARMCLVETAGRGSTVEEREAAVVWLQEAARDERQQVAAARRKIAAV